MINVVRQVIQGLRNFIRRTFHIDNPNLAYYVSIVIAIALFGLALNAFIQLTDELVDNELGPFDETVTKKVISFRTDGLTFFFKVMTDLGDQTAYIIVIIALALYFFLRHRNWQFIAQTVVVLLLATLTNVLLKHAIHRKRPSIEHLVEVYSLSYPSGHAMSAMAFYGFLIYLVVAGPMRKRLKVLMVIFLSAIILSIGVSRIYLGVHFPSDVLAGFIGGFLWVTLCIIIFNILYLLRIRRQRQT
jgi:membrane-associated phospholipid phosphatase